MDNLLLNRYLRLIEPLSVDLKLALVSALTDSIRENLEPKRIDKQALFEELKGAWADIDVDIEREIYDSRSISDRDISLDL